jgi:hypothetical protein
MREPSGAAPSRRHAESNHLLEQRFRAVAARLAPGGTTIMITFPSPALVWPGDDSWATTAVAGAKWRLLLPCISLDRECPSCWSGLVSKGSRHQYGCDACGHGFSGFRLGPVRLAWLPGGREPLTAFWVHTACLIRRIVAHRDTGYNPTRFRSAHSDRLAVLRRGC